MEEEKEVSNFCPIKLYSDDIDKVITAVRDLFNHAGSNLGLFYKSNLKDISNV